MNRQTPFIVLGCIFEYNALTHLEFTKLTSECRGGTKGPLRHFETWNVSSRQKSLFCVLAPLGLLFVFIFRPETLDRAAGPGRRPRPFVAGSGRPHTQTHTFTKQRCILIPKNTSFFKLEGFFSIVFNKRVIIFSIWMMCVTRFH